MGYKEILKLRDKLKEKGYADSLWHIDDVKQNYKCDDETAWKCLNDALSSESVYQTIFESIDIYAMEKYNLKSKE